MSKSVQRRLAIQSPEMLTIDKAVETILEELEITDNLVNVTIDVSNSNTEILMEKIKQQEEIIEALQSQIENNTSSKMIELSTENKMLKRKLKINDLALKIAVNECGKITAVQAYQLAKKAIEGVNNGN